VREKNWAVFRADAFPDDCIEDDLDIIRFPGLNIAEALTDILSAIGCSDIEKPSEEGEHGWHVHFRSDGKPFFCQVSRIEPETLLLFEKSYGSEGWFYKGLPRFPPLLEKIKTAIAQDDRFRDLQWYTDHEMKTADWLLEAKGDVD
jgi:hypothetical protein